ncbi:Polyketide cyclase/dehydrase and lipid transport superfamily protein [Rhynchospora pubera]|uniref:Polyketide cyclase/dehydrase and lipid transport superfamily protein n=1 Tax=Rhynchospora pubera TaxID=906938 RepID=A0AAV8CV24_9POAL|nr:Polyketide cyclase/dehydrase and lipid transport superfamily protein [Rhynchospora pubera]
MAVILNCLIEILKKPAIGEIFSELAIFFAPLWIALAVGLFVGWAWRPSWAVEKLGFQNSDSSANEEKTRVGSSVNLPSRGSTMEEKEVIASRPMTPEKELAVSESDLDRLCRLVEERDGGPTWHKMMEKSLPTWSYQAWRRDPEAGPTQYRSSTVFEDATPEIVRDFFGDDEFRTKNGWDDMLLVHEILDECAATGTMVVKWVRKFPFFCSDREYIIGRRIWNVGRTYYCITKGVPNDVPRHNKPRRVDLYYSSWCIRPVESKRDGQMTACEVLLFHHEEMGIPREIAKLGVRQGMWGCVRRIEPGLRAYQLVRSSPGTGPVSHYVEMARINTKFNAEEVALREEETCEDASDLESDGEAKKPQHWIGNVPKVLAIGGAVALACTIDHGLVTKAVIFGVARQFARIGKRL